MKKLLALVMALSMLLSYLPVSALAQEVNPEEEPPAEIVIDPAETPAQPEPAPADPAPAQPEPTPADPAPAQPESAPADPDPVDPEAAPADPVPDETDPAAAAVAVSFLCQPAEARITVYALAGDAKTEILTETPGSYELQPGTYCYSAELEGYDSVTEEPFQVEAGLAGLEVPVTLVQLPEEMSQDEASMLKPGELQIDAENFPDAAFREYVSTSLDQDHDGSLSVTERNAVTEITPGKVGSLQGIAFFPNLENLRFGGGTITSLDLSENTKVKYLYCRGNGLTELKLGDNTVIEFIDCSQNALTSLDFRAYASLKFLHCGENPLTSLNVTGNKKLLELNCRSAESLTSLDLSGNPELYGLDCSYTALASLDISSNLKLSTLYVRDLGLTELNLRNYTELADLDCNDNQLTSLDLSANTALWHLECHRNQLTSLDLSANTALRSLRCNENRLQTLKLNCPELVIVECSGNQLTSLDLGSGAAIQTFRCTDNRYTCEMADGSLDLNTLIGFDVTRASAWTGGQQVNGILTPDNGDTPVSYTYDCGRGQTARFIIQNNAVSVEVTPIDKAHFPDANFRKYISDNLDMNKDGSLSKTECEAVKKIDVFNQKIQTMKGIEYFTALEDLNCSSNKFTDLDLSANTHLLSLNISFNKLNTLNIRACTALHTLDCSSAFDFLAAEEYDLDLSHNSGLVKVSCTGYGVRSLNLSNLTKLENVTVSEFAVNLTGCTALKKLTCSPMQGGAFDLTLISGIDFSAASQITGGILRGQKFYVDGTVEETNGYGQLSYLGGFQIGNMSVKFIMSELEDISAITINAANFPDDVFRSYVGKTFDKNRDGKLSSQEIEAVTDIQLYNQYEDNVQLNSAEGIAWFPNLQSLNVSGWWSLRALDVTHNPALVSLHLENCRVSSIDLSHNTRLQDLGITGNPLSGLDLSHQSGLQFLNCGGYDSPMAVDLTGCTELVRVDCELPVLSDFDLSLLGGCQFADDTAVAGGYIRNGKFSFNGEEMQNIGGGYLYTADFQANGVQFVFSRYDTKAVMHWFQVGRKWMYGVDRNDCLKNQLFEDNGNTYYLDARGYMATGWQTVEGQQYYFGTDGAMVRNQWVDEKYIGADGTVDTSRFCPKWMKEGRNFWYRHEDGSRTVNDWEQIDGFWYHFDENGYRQSGWILNNTYYLGKDGKMVTGPYKIGRDQFLFHEDGHKLTGWQDVGETRRYFDADGRMVLNGWGELDGHRCYIDSKGNLLTSAKKVGRDQYLFNDQGYMQTGWQETKDGQRYFAPDGHMVLNDWAEIDGQWYYLDRRGDKLTGRSRIGRDYYYFNEEGQRQTGWQTVNDEKQYYKESGIQVLEDWAEIDGQWYYLDRNSQKLTGLQRIGRDFYFFNKEGQRQTGWQVWQEDRYYFDPATGEMWMNRTLEIESDRYYLDRSGRMATGLTKVGRVTYYFDLETGKMQTGWQMIDEKKMAFNDDGQLVTRGFLKLNGETYYLDRKGNLTIGQVKVGRDCYRFGEDGKMLTGWYQENGQKYYYRENLGQEDAKDAGKMAIGWAEIGGQKHYFDKNGQMHTGWLKLGRYRYYLAVEDGHMLTGTHDIEGVEYTFDESGRLLPNR